MKKLLTMFTAIGLTATSASPILNNAVKQDEPQAFVVYDEGVNLEYGTNSMTISAYDTYSRNTTKINNFSNEGLETSTNTYQRKFSNEIAEYLIENDDVTFASVDGEFIANGFNGAERYKSILLTREPSSSDQIVTFSGSIGSNMNAPEIKPTISWQISLSMTIYKDANNQAFVDTTLVHQATDGNKKVDPVSQEQGIKLISQLEQTVYYRNNSVEENQDLGNETILQASNLYGSNAALVTSQERVVTTSVSGMTGYTVKNDNLDLERTKRISFYGKMRNAVVQPKYVSDYVTSSIDFIKDEQDSTEHNLVFESNYQAIYDNPGVGKFNSTINFTFEINIDPITNIASFKNQSTIDLDNRERGNQQAWMENTQVFDRATFWG